MDEFETEGGKEKISVFFIYVVRLSRFEGGFILASPPA